MARSEWCGVALVAVIVILLVLRLPVGIDLSDESYYAIFLDDWLKGSIASSTLITLHQTAALLLYPAAWLFVTLTGSSEGLFLFLRFLFLGGALLSAAAWINMLRRLDTAWRAWFVGAIVLAFVPFSLPAPSYNTIGQQWMTIGLAAYGCMALAETPRSRVLWRIVSAIAWMLATIAYPTLIAPLGVLVVASLWLDRRAAEHPSTYMLFIAVALVAGWAVVIGTLSARRLWDSVVYLSQINNTGGLSRKLSFTVDILGLNLAFAALCVTATAVGLLRNRLDPRLTALAVATILAATLLLPPALFVRSHDVVTLAALSGLGLLRGLRRGASPSERLVATLYATSLVAGLVTAVTATNAVYNACIGALPAATLALTIKSRPDDRQRLSLATAPIAALAAILSTTLFVYYGELPGPGEPRQRIANGFFAGIWARPNDVALLDIVRTHVTPLLAAEPTIAIFARSPGLILDGPGRIKMLTAFPLMPDVPAAGLAATHNFYEDAAHRPAVVLIYEDPYFKPVNPMGAHFPSWYRPAAALATPLGRLSVFVRR